MWLQRNEKNTKKIYINIRWCIFLVSSFEFALALYSSSSLSSLFFFFSAMSTHSTCIKQHIFRVIYMCIVSNNKLTKVYIFHLYRLEKKIMYDVLLRFSFNTFLLNNIYIDILQSTFSQSVSYFRSSFLDYLFSKKTFHCLFLLFLFFFNFLSFDVILCSALKKLKEILTKSSDTTYHDSIKFPRKRLDLKVNRFVLLLAKNKMILQDKKNVDWE